jgi:hypothetical protein
MNQLTVSEELELFGGDDVLFEMESAPFWRSLWSTTGRGSLIHLDDPQGEGDPIFVEKGQALVDATRQH